MLCYPLADVDVLMYIKNHNYIYIVFFTSAYTVPVLYTQYYAYDELRCDRFKLKFA